MKTHKKTPVSKTKTARKPRNYTPKGLECATVEIWPHVVRFVRPNAQTDALHILATDDAHFARLAGERLAAEWQIPVKEFDAQGNEIK